MLEYLIETSNVQAGVNDCLPGGCSELPTAYALQEKTFLLQYPSSLCSYVLRNPDNSSLLSTGLRESPLTFLFILYSFQESTLVFL